MDTGNNEGGWIMSLSLNKVSVAGRLGRDPELKQLGGGQTVASFSVATSRKFKNKSGEQQEETTWVDCEAWGKTADFVGQYFKKGSAIYVDARLRNEEWETKDGQKRQRIKLVCENVQFVEGKRDDARTDPVPPKKSDHAAKQVPAENADDESIPF